ncbi:MAG: hypothetical protein KDC43_10005 [Saprospiraceae bacterium]|nr:hypothetical protein [Saprospiraceae bacterium]MCB0624221.1 hypothetical protein [Saprospiraceae bacterium]MCB0676131.1 hypothetical protein [Saprospiraceae bacterium]MCB0683763.1 hypothetical protein [Saprospiraceae bacterium]
MKQLLLLCFWLGSSALALAQEAGESPEIDPRLYAVYDASYLSNLQKHNPTIIQRLNYYLDHAYYLTDYPAEKGEPTFQTIAIEDLDHFNILLLEKEFGLTRNFEKQTYYLIEGTRKVLVYHSGKRFNEMLNEHLGRTPSDAAKDR